MPQKTKKDSSFDLEAWQASRQAIFTWPITGSFSATGGVCWVSWSINTTIANRIVMSKQEIHIWKRKIVLYLIQLFRQHQEVPEM